MLVYPPRYEMAGKGWLWPLVMLQQDAIQKEFAEKVPYLATYEDLLWTAKVIVGRRFPTLSAGDRDFIAISLPTDYVDADNPYATVAAHKVRVQLLLNMHWDEKREIRRSAEDLARKVSSALQMNAAK